MLFGVIIGSFVLSIILKASMNNVPQDYVNVNGFWEYLE